MPQAIVRVLFIGLTAWRPVATKRCLMHLCGNGSVHALFRIQGTPRYKSCLTTKDGVGFPSALKIQEDGVRLINGNIFAQFRLSSL